MCTNDWTNNLLKQSTDNISHKFEQRLSVFCIVVVVRPYSLYLSDLYTHTRKGCRIFNYHMGFARVPWKPLMRATLWTCKHDSWFATTLTLSVNKAAIARPISPCCHIRVSSAGARRMKMNRVGTATSVRSPSNSDVDRRPNTITGEERTSSLPTRMLAVSVPAGIFRIKLLFGWKYIGTLLIEIICEVS